MAVALADWSFLDARGGRRVVLCPFLALTGLACPLCGGTRAAHDLARGDVPAALGHNPVLTLLLPAAVALWVRWLVRRRRDPVAAYALVSGRRAVLGAVALTAFAVARNLPGGQWLGP